MKHIKRVEKWLIPAMRAKYERGVREHGGGLDKRPVSYLLDEIKGELIDLIVYIERLEEQIRRRDDKETKDILSGADSKTI